MLNRVGATIDTVVGTVVGTLFDIVVAVVGAGFGYQYEPGKKYDPKEDALRRWQRRSWRR